MVSTQARRRARNGSSHPVPPFPRGSGAEHMQNARRCSPRRRRRATRSSFRASTSRSSTSSRGRWSRRRRASRAAPSASPGVSSHLQSAALIDPGTPPHPAPRPAGAQVAAAHQGTETGVLHRLGPREHPGGPLAQVAVRPDGAPRLRAYARQPHLHPPPLHALPHAVRQAHAPPGFPRQLRAARHVQGARACGERSAGSPRRRRPAPPRRKQLPCAPRGRRADANRPSMRRRRTICPSSRTRGRSSRTSRRSTSAGPASDECHFSTTFLCLSPAARLRSGRQGGYRLAEPYLARGSRGMS